jgi:cyclopropane-fatty-acyl-phospholipid synthase
MQYTCGLFRSGRESLEDSQIAKFELIKRLIAPKDESLNSLNHLDIGCGWGGLIEFFTTNYGTNSIGVTNSRRQYEYNKKQGRGGRVVFGDFLELKNADKRFDVITVVGMIEHLPTARRDELFALMRNILSPSGKIYLQCIARPSCWIGGDAYRLAQKHVFPGHFLQSRDETNDLISRHGFVVEWSEDHAAHYGHTTAHWIRNIAQSKRLICDEIGERNYRLFHGYLGYASRLFLTGRGSLLRYAISVV